MAARMDQTIRELDKLVTRHLHFPARELEGPAPGTAADAEVHVPSGRYEAPDVFDERFSRCVGLLTFIAARVLEGHNGVEEAVRNCWTTASSNPPHFEHETTFRGWLLRILIDEALAILRRKPVRARPAAL